MPSEVSLLPSAIWIFTKPAQFWKALAPIVLTLAGIFSVVKPALLQPRKDCVPSVRSGTVASSSYEPKSNSFSLVSP